MTTLRKPDFIIVGAPRSGSTYLMENLNSHPQVFMPKPAGEHSTGDLHFFDVSREEGRLNYSRGLAWYLGHFAEARPSQVAGEKTADYLADEEACSLIHDALGPIQIIIILRDPVARAYSHFWHERHNLSQFASFEEFLDGGSDVGDALVLTSSFYCESIRRYQKLFGANRTMVLIAEEMYSRPQTALESVCRFLKIKDDFKFPLRGARINRGTAEASVQWIRSIATRISRLTPGLYENLRNSGAASLVNAYVARRRGTGRHVGRQETEDSSYPRMRAEEISRLRAIFESDVIATADLLHKDLRKIWWQ